MGKRSGVTAAKGFIAGGLHCGVKKVNEPDLAMIVSDPPAVGWGVFTTNRVKGAPVVVSRSHLRSRYIRGVVANSGNSNTLTENALRDAKRMAVKAAEMTGCRAGQMIVASTGVIGQPLPIRKIENGIAELAPTLDEKGGAAAAKAIMTTDLVSKEASASYMAGRRKITVGGCAKGSGMVHPNMATMLCFVTTDAAISKNALKALTKEANAASFARVTVDGDTSTSDMLIILANGASGAPMIDKPSGARYRALVKNVCKVCADLAKKVAMDGEGATKFITVAVKGAKRETDAKKTAMAVAKSSLVKTAMFGEDANWGRILCAVGYCGAPIDPERITLKIGGITVYRNGAVAAGDWEKRLAPKLKNRNIRIDIDLGAGKAGAEVWTCDLSYDYVKINADYRT